MVSALALGFLIGMQHALEADHLAAVGAMAAQTVGSHKTMAPTARLGGWATRSVSRSSAREQSFWGSP